MVKKNRISVGTFQNKMCPLLIFYIISCNKLHATRLQAMAQKIQEGNIGAKQPQENNELKNVIKESEAI